ncbi:MAG: DUF192 domain-containing protein [Candidatus Hydrothermarchaeales archaeon]
MERPAALFITLLFSLFMVHNTQGYVVDAVSFDNGVVVQVEVAQTPAQLETGLMYREGLKDYSGMLFIFESEARHRFWMKNMNFPIDIIWMDSNLDIVDITREAAPCSKEPCQIYSPAVSARYMLEVPAGFSQENGIKIGERIGFKRKGQ